jgi:hypothetical protein
MTPQIGILVSVSADGRLDIPPELQSQMEPLSRYEVLVTSNEIIFKRIPGQPHTFLNKREYISQQSAKAKQ